MTAKSDPGLLLLIEDDPHDVELMQLALAPLRFINQMDVVTDGQQALRYLIGDDNHPSHRLLPRLVLLDLKLPRINGLEVLRTLRANPRTKKLIIVVMTSSQEDADLEACYELCSNSYIVKPVDFEQFLEVSTRVVSYWMHLNKPPALITP